MSDKPVLTSGVVVAFVAALLVLLRAFGVPIGDDKQRAILEMIPVAWALGFALWYAIQNGVSGNVEVDRDIDAAWRMGNRAAGGVAPRGFAPVTRRQARAFARREDEQMAA